MRATDEGHIGALDGLRAAAIVLVLLFHLTPGRNPDLGLLSIPAKVAEIGWSGVDLFFVLSGYLITTKLLASRGEPDRFRNFYARRALRIFPLYYAALFVALIAIPLALPSLRVPSARAQLPFWLYFSNFALHRLGIEHVVSLGHFWSLAIEEQFYLVWPALIFLARRRTAAGVCVAVVCAAPVLRWWLAANGFSWTATYGWTPLRTDGIALGALIALTGPSRFRRLAPLVACAAAGLAALAAWFGKAGLVVTGIATREAVAVRALLPTAVALLFAAALVLALEAAPIARVLTGRAQTSIARYSYGLYVVHYLFVSPAERALLPWLRGFGANTAAFLFFAITATISFALAVVSYHTLERYFLRFKPRFPEGGFIEART